MKERLWERKYRPAKIEDYIFQNKDHKEFVESFIVKNDIPNLLLSGIQGTGKTSLALMLIDLLNLSPLDVMKINASVESGIDTVRDRIINFCMPMPLGDYKIILFEEADRLSAAAQEALRSVIDEHSDTVRFVFTCNYVHKIIPALQSRFQSLEFEAFEKDHIYQMLIDIFVEEDITVNDEEILISHVETYYPDLRKIINSVQQSSVGGVLSEVISKTTSNDVIDEWNRIWSSTPTLDALIALVPDVDNNNVDELYRVMYDNVSNLPDDAVLRTIPIIAEHLYRVPLVVDQEINMCACLINIFSDE